MTVTTMPTTDNQLSDYIGRITIQYCYYDDYDDKNDGNDYDSW